MEKEFPEEARYGLAEHLAMFERLKAGTISAAEVKEAYARIRFGEDVQVDLSRLKKVELRKLTGASLHLAKNDQIEDAYRTCLAWCALPIRRKFPIEKEDFLHFTDYSVAHLTEEHIKKFAAENAAEEE